MIGATTTTAPQPSDEHPAPLPRPRPQAPPRDGTGSDGDAVTAAARPVPFSPSRPPPPPDGLRTMQQHSSRSQLSAGLGAHALARPLVPSSARLCAHRPPWAAPVDRGAKAMVTRPSADHTADWGRLLWVSLFCLVFACFYVCFCIICTALCGFLYLYHEQTKTPAAELWVLTSVGCRKRPFCNDGELNISPAHAVPVASARPEPRRPDQNPRAHGFIKTSFPSYSDVRNLQL